MIASGKEIHFKGAMSNALTAGEKDVKCVAWSPDGKFFATGSDDGHLIVWDASAHIRYDYERSKRFNAITFIPNPSDPSTLVIAGAGDDKEVYILHLKTGPGATIKN